MDPARLRLSAALLSVGTALLLTAMKVVVAWRAGSMSVLASALDSALDMLSSMVIVIAVVTANRPADHEHRYGHGKAEALAGFTQSIFVSLSGLYLVYRAVDRLLAEPRPLEQTGAALVVMLVSLVATILLITYQGHVARKTDSAAIRADRLHYLSDVAANLAILFVLTLERYVPPETTRGLPGGLLEPGRPDLIAALIAAAFVLKSALDIFRESFNILMDRDVSHLYRETVQEFIRAQAGVLGYHNLRSRSAGTAHFLEVHLEVNRSLSFEESHEIAESLTRRLRSRFKKLEVSVHTDPVSPGHRDDHKRENPQFR